MTTDKIKPGIIVNMRNRLWRVDEFDGIEVVATPITGNSDDQKTFLADIEDISEERFESINANLPGDLTAQRLLLRAYQFDLIHGSAPFLSLHRSSIVPYNYQMVPLVLALENPNTRMLIGDDVGLGKTIEAGLIISELIQRGKVKRVLFLTPANLKPQWKEALEYFFHIKATIIDSYSRKEFEKELPAGANPWQYFQFVIASVDYAKSPDIKQQISEQDWDFMLVDEVHLCAKPHSKSNVTKQQKRYELVKDLGKKIPNVLFLTATPHNGYSDSFASILEILNPEIVTRKSNGDITFDKNKARYNVIQRNRKKLEAWYKKQGKNSPFPKRDQKEVIIDPKPNGKLIQLLDAVERYGDFILKSAQENNSNGGKNIANWVAIHLQKRAISSPYAVLKSLENRIATIENNVDNITVNDAETLENYVFDFVSDDERVSDEMASLKLDFEALSSNEIEELKSIIEFGKTLTPKDDEKLQNLKNVILPELMAKDPKVIVFTKYKDTLDYLEKNLKTKEFDTFIMHGDMSLMSRTEIFGKFDRAKRAILIATDVISEGLNLQRLASNIVHYELPWNPNRLEQRNGRIDRIGQKRETVCIRTLVVDKTLDKEILDLLLEKTKTIEIDRDYAAAFFGDEEYLKSIIFEASSKKRSKKKNVPDGPDLFSTVGVDETKKAVRQSFSFPEEDKKRKMKIEEESFYSSLDIELPEIDKRIEETKRIVGSQDQVLIFVKSALARFNSALIDKGSGFYEITINDDRLVLQRFGDTIKKVTFDPELGLTNPDAIILDAGHPFVRKLIELVKAEFFTNKGLYGRNAYFFSDEVESVHYNYNFLVRFTVGIKEKRVIEELVSLTVDSYSDKEISNTNFSPATTTRNLSQSDFTEYINEALQLASLDKIIQNKIEELRFKLINERQELYKKILIESKNSSQPTWLDDIIYIEKAGYDLLTVTIIQPLN
ncbi:helicase-related protein [Flavobacterium xueshanense]|uniref:SNF2 family N-terminal domain-containing protein n=1 Tax=Flavobacterium xueshanense TaxID=935223 RepID=A0A1I2HDS5_9FLAO|nr:helicase-related protein [Flavobacterium xueshanense]SFF27460.1 SNF2 family N-terminal domain-containing protein [Flavobacterium xueshanense]